MQETNLILFFSFLHTKKHLKVSLSHSIIQKKGLHKNTADI